MVEGLADTLDGMIKQQIIPRLEEWYGADVVGEVLRYLGCVSYGLTLEELKRLMAASSNASIRKLPDGELVGLLDGAHSFAVNWSVAAADERSKGVMVGCLQG